MNNANQGNSADKKKAPTSFGGNQSIEALNKQHFELSNGLHFGFTTFKDEHSRLVKE